MGMYCEKKTVGEKSTELYEAEGARPRGRAKKTGRQIVEKDCQACKLNKEDDMNHKRWRKQIRDD